MESATRVLIAEDEAMIAILLTEIVEQLGHNVCDVAATEAEAIAMAMACQPGLIIIDAGLREGSGIAAMNTILQHRFVPHVYVTGDKYLAQSLARQAIVLEKPFFAWELSNAIAKALGTDAQA